MVEVKKRRGESFEGLLRRFKHKMQMSGRILQAKKVRFHQSDPNKTEIKKSALRRIELAEHYEHLRKIGKLPEDNRRNKRRTR